MLDRVQISENKDKSVSILVLNEDATVQFVSSVPIDEWKQLRAKALQGLIETQDLPFDSIDYLVAVMLFAEID